MFFGNFVAKKPENKREGISPNYNNPQKGYALPGAKRFLSGSLGFLLLSPGAILKFSIVSVRISDEDYFPLYGHALDTAEPHPALLRLSAMISRYVRRRRIVTGLNVKKEQRDR
jgi:hypothetical protein